MSLNVQSHLRRQSFDPSCPSGGQFYACPDEKTHFVGCCREDACLKGCSAGNVEPASFDASHYGKIADQQCPTNDTGWYTCADTDPPFMGCCRINPCASGCPSGEVLAGFLSSNPGEAADFLPSSSATTASHSATSSSGASAAGTSSSGSIQDTSAAAATTRVSQSIHHTNTGTIAGSAIGGFVAVAILLTVFALLFRRRAIRSRQQAAHSRARARAAGKEIPDQDVKHASETAPLSKDMEKNEYSQGKLTRTCVEDEKADLIIEAHELMSIPADTNASGRPYSELDGGGLVQRTPGPSPQPPPGFSSPHVSSISSDSPRLHQSWGGHSYGRDSVM